MNTNGFLKTHWWHVHSGLTLGTHRHSTTTYHTDVRRKSCWCEQLLAPLLLLSCAPPFPLVLTQLCIPSPGRAHRGTNPAGKHPAQGKDTTATSSWRWGSLLVPTWSFGSPRSISSLGPAATACRWLARWCSANSPWRWSASSLPCPKCPCTSRQTL